MNIIEQNEYCKYIYKSRYARWRDDLERRENWEESVTRLCDFWKEKSEFFPYKLIYDAIYEGQTMPSMRSLMTAGKALERDNVAGFNCAFVAIDDPKAFDEILYILACGTGVGFSVERQEVQQLPVVAEEFFPTDTIIQVKDSKIGWASGLRELISLLYSGKTPTWDLSKVRPAGALLKTFGGRACLTGDTVVYKDRKKSRDYNEITISDLYDLQHSLGFWKNKPNHFKDVLLRSLDEESGEFFRNNVLDVIDNGVVPVYEMITKNGYRIKATANHRFMRQDGDYQTLDKFTVGDQIAVNGSKEPKTGICIDCGSSITRRAIRCRSCTDKAQILNTANHTTARQRKECREYLGDSCERCGTSPNRLIVHHKDENPLNNNHANLETLCETCHRRHHAKTDTFGDAYAHRYVSYDTIASITLVGEERVFDLAMEGPNHNFIANGFVSHNSGPNPLNDLFKFTVALFSKAQGRKLTSLECHDLVCKIAEIIVVGGVRRSALISLSNLSDDRMRKAKQGAWWDYDGQRALANNAAAYADKPEIGAFMDEWKSIYDSKCGERGIFNRDSANRQARKTGRRKVDPEIRFGTNPCGEILLRSCQFCNLTEAVIRADDTLETLKEKVRIATILGTFQSTLTDFRYLRKVWKKNTEEERLLGVSLTGCMDHHVMAHVTAESKRWKEVLKQVAIETNKEWSEVLGISQSVSITCNKPSGTVSQLMLCGSGIHGWYAPYYIRTVRADKKDPLAQLMMEAGVPHEDDVTKPDSTVIFSFPIAAPKGARLATDISALEQLEIWKTYHDDWCEHNPSVTIYVKEDEWLEVGAWVYKHFDDIGGLSFLPYSDHVYKQAPYQPCTKEVYEAAVKAMPKIPWDKLADYEQEDHTTGMQELACMGGACTI